VTPRKPTKGKSTMHDLHASDDADRDLAEAEEHLLAADAAHMHRLLVWYYAGEPRVPPRAPSSMGGGKFAALRRRARSSPSP
jgi:hypothetical protein